MSKKIDDVEDVEEIETEEAEIETESLEEFNEEALLKRFASDDGGEPLEESLEATSDDSVSENESVEVEGTELASYESAEIEEEEFVEEDTIVSVVESILFSTEKPVSIATIKQAFKGTQVRTTHIRRALDSLAVDYAGGRRGVTLEEVNGGYQLRTKVDNLNFLRQMIKIRPFKLSGPALEVLAIIAYKQPLIKSQVDEIRGVESGHLMRALMEKGLVNFGEKSELPGKPMYYQTTRKFLEIFGLRNIKELPSLSEIDDLIPEGIDEETAEKETLSDVTDKMSTQVGMSYSDGEEELMKISSELSDITTSSEFFEQEKVRMRMKKEAERAQDIRDAMTVGEEVADKDKKWLERYDARLLAEQQGIAVASGETEDESSVEQVATSDSVGKIMTDLDQAMTDFNNEDGINEDQEAVDPGKYEEDLAVFEEDEESDESKDI